ncbi:MAG: gamma-glutamyltransferase, partial [Pseudomonadota bacterium]
PQAGDQYAAPGLAEALEAIDAKGPAGFYEGPIAEDMAATLALLGGPHRAADFAGVSAERARPLSAEAFGPDHRLTTTPPNSQGAVAHLIMAILAQAPARLLSADPFGPERLHWESEAVKLAYGARDRLLGEPSPEMDAAIAKLLAPETAAGLAAEIAPDRAAPLDAAAARAAARYRGAPHEDTVVLSAVDRDGGACTLITSLFNAFGTGVASERYGVLMHSRGAGFTLKPDHPNSARPGARPLHTMMPSLLFEKGRLRMAFGVMGGQYQAAGQAWLLGSRLRYGLDLQTAIDGPRAFPERAADAPDAAPTERLRTERGVDDATRAALRAFGHPVRESLLPLGGAQAIEIDWERGALIGAADPRKDGCALGW